MGAPPGEVEQSKNLCVILSILGSLVCFATAADFMVHDTSAASDAQLGWAVACGVISFVVLIAFVVLEKMRPELTEKFGSTLFGFLTLWWVFAVGFLTGSSGDYKNSNSCPTDERISVFAETNNGYFAVWVTFSSCFYYFYLCAPNLATSIEGKEFANGLVTVSFASLVEFCAAADIETSDGWAIACGLIGFVVAFLQMILRSYAPAHSRKTAPVVGIFLVIWWTFGVGFITSGNGPFFNTCCERANGYFSTWVSFLGSIYYCYKTLIDYQYPVEPVILEGPDDETQVLTGSPTNTTRHQGYQEPVPVQAEAAIPNDGDVSEFA
mmetsp:Transcript_18175/g.28475  ORF Transcript_18175/g.28475 Transcript_18175/m.28475 type:complete len:324 (-) Transcript_18175:49-1020(-)|eukprot:CAMPEP_0201524274 /NCGR_PEP_ID=MMETSP0161_2-20130828/21217_1 /ASSEMBLY_ACC=CAM_ASM_000251 /TAXON_ID=180227 /ORGANISM="Neoparamoeba aestuarina, Strain SoJaBio B1-5/56/2" /LENGTH=323 /DNA_ID=CAMNT_0047923583 /DNA_START=95 /DNA_END=1069 /DNA_ORIENTATION=-